MQIAPGKEGLVHISQLAPTRVEKVEDVVKVGDEVMVKVLEVDHQGRINLSRKALLNGAGGDDGGGRRPPSERRDEPPVGASAGPGAPPMRRRRRPQGGRHHGDE